MLILTFQKKEVASELLKGTYTPDLRKSPFAFSTVRFTEAYSKILRKLKRKNPGMSNWEGCLWGWVSNPDERMVKNYLNRGFVAIYIDVDKSKVVLSDYNRYTMYAQEESSDDKFILAVANKNSTCVQCSFTVDAIQSIRGVFGCKDMLLYPDIARCYYTMMLLRNIKGKTPEVYDIGKLKVNNYLKKVFFVTRQVFSNKYQESVINSV